MNGKALTYDFTLPPSDGSVRRILDANNPIQVNAKQHIATATVN